MVTEVVVIAGLTLLGERAYKAYKRGTLITDITKGAAQLKADVVAVEQKVTSDTSLAGLEVQALLASAKLILGKLGL